MWLGWRRARGTLAGRVPGARWLPRRGPVAAAHGTARAGRARPASRAGCSLLGAPRRPLDQLAQSLLGMERYEDPVARPGAWVGRRGRRRARACPAPCRGAAVSPAAALDADVCVSARGPAAPSRLPSSPRVARGWWCSSRAPDHDPDGFTARPMEMMARLYRDGGQTVTLGAPPILLLLGRGIGGTTLVNSGTCFRTPARVLERWRREYGLELDGGELDPCFERVERALSVAEVTPELAGANAAVARRGAERLGWSHGYLRRNARGCVGSGVCAFGCPTSAKQHTGITYLPRAETAGAHILTGADVQRIVVEGGRARGVQARLGPGRGAVWGRRRCPRGAGRPIGTVAREGRVVLGGVGGARPPRGSGRRHDPHAAAARAQWARGGFGTARAQPRAAPRHRRLCADGRGGRHGARACRRASTWTSSLREGIMFEGIAGPPAYAALSLPLTGARHAAAMANYRHLAQFGLMVSDCSRGRVRSLRARGGALIRYDLVRGRRRASSAAASPASMSFSRPPARARSTCRCPRACRPSGLAPRSETDGLPSARNSPRRRATPTRGVLDGRPARARRRGAVRRRRHVCRARSASTRRSRSWRSPRAWPTICCAPAGPRASPTAHDEEAHVLPDRPTLAVRHRPRLWAADARAHPAARAIGKATAGAFLATSVSLYFDRPWTRRSGRRAARRVGATGCSTPASSVSTSAARDGARTLSPRCCSPPTRCGCRSAKRRSRCALVRRRAAATFAEPYSGMLPCLRLGPGSRLVCSVRSAVISRGRVSWGTITSSM